MIIRYHDAKQCDIASLKALYQSVGWEIYTEDMKRFKEMFENAYDVIGAFDGEALVGLIRVLSDGAHIVYIQDVLVKPEKQRQGIGKKLLSHVLDKYKDIRQKVLITDASSKESQAFYRSVGLQEASEMKITCFLTLS